MNESAWHRHPPRPISSLIVDDIGPNPDPYLPSELLTEPAKNWPRQIYWSLNICIVLLFAIFVVLGIGAIGDEVERREEKSRVEFCERWERDFPNFPPPTSCE